MTGKVTLREVNQDDLAIFFEQQLDPEATRMAAFPSRAHDAFMAHWTKCMAEESSILRTILYHGKVAGNVVCWQQAGEARIGYWLGKAYWGKGIATAAVSQFLRVVTVRPLYARVTKHNAASIRVLEKCGFTKFGEDTFSDSDGREMQEVVLTLETRIRDEAK